MLSFCKIDFVYENFAFMNTLQGKGGFYIFCATTFLISGIRVMGYVLFAFLVGMGITFIVWHFQEVKVEHDHPDDIKA